METIFDIATPKELTELLGADISILKMPGAFAFERKAVQDSPDTSAGLLAQLYAMRGKPALAEEYLAKITDEQTRLDYSLLIQELAQ